MIVTLLLKNLKFKLANTLLSIILLAFGTGIISLLLLVEKQINEKLNNDLEGIDLVVGAKGSPLQLILSAVYQLDAPTGNIPLAEANKIGKHPLVLSTIPLAYGDSYAGYRIVGTTENYLKKYNATLAIGTLFTNSFEVVIGNQLASKENLQVGSIFTSTHGLSKEGGTAHTLQQYKVAGILNPTNSVIDQLIITSIESVWEIHDEHETKENHQHEEDNHKEEKSITALLVTYRSKMAMMLLPRQINENTKLQAASPIIEINRLTNLIGLGVKTLQIIAWGIIAISGLSIFISLYSRLQERKYELALMRSLGAKKWTLACLMFGESILLCIIGCLVGFCVSRLGLWFLHKYSMNNYHMAFNQLFLTKEEYFLFVTTIIVGFAAAIIPSVQTLKISISKTLSYV